MSDFTPRANLRLPGGGSTGTILPDEQVDIDVLNDNFRKIDALLGARNIPSASSYAGSMDGDLVYARDTEFLHMFSANDGGLITPRLPGSKMYSGTAAERAAFTTAKLGDQWLDTDNIGVIWRFVPGSPGTWHYTGNQLSGTLVEMNALVTAGLAREGMKVWRTDGIKGTYHFLGGTAWHREGATVATHATGGSLASSTWTVQSAPSIWNLGETLMDSGNWNQGIVVPEDGTYLVTYSLHIATALTIIVAVKKNNTAASITGAITGAVHVGQANITIASCSRLVTLAKNDVLTPVAWTSGAAGPYGLTGAGTHFALERVL